MNNKIAASLKKTAIQKDELFKFLDSLDESKLDSLRKDGSWNILQVLTHLHEVEYGSLMYMKKKSLGLKELENCNWKSNVNSGLLQVILYLPTKFKAPKIVSNPNVTMSYKELKAALIILNENYAEFLNGYEECNMRKAIYKHPFVGRLTVLQMLKFNRAHIFHHKRQIKNILKA